MATIHDRQKLETAIERAITKMFQGTTEHVYDFVKLYIMRNKLELDKYAVDKTLDLVRAAIKDGYMTKMDEFQKNIATALTEFTSTENPTQPIGKKMGRPTRQED